jgi:hypothetical protein
MNAAGTLFLGVLDIIFKRRSLRQQQRQRRLLVAIDLWQDTSYAGF